MGHLTHTNGAFRNRCGGFIVKKWLEVVERGFTAHYVAVIGVCIHTYIHTYMHACMHTYIQTYIYIYVC